MNPQADGGTDSTVTETNRASDTANRFQGEFDALLFWLIGLGLAASLLYGASAATCPAPNAAPAASTAREATAPGTAARVATARPSLFAPPASGASAPVPPATPQVPARPATNAAPAPGGQPAAAGAQRQTTAERGHPATQRCGSGDGFVGMLLALFIALSALALGTFIGFLFGLPRSLTSSEFRAARQQAAAANPADPATAANPAGPANPDRPFGAAAPGSGSDVNTNLEKISDWLTTIIVGVGLTKLQDIPSGIEAFGDRVAPFFGYGGKVFGIGGGLFFLIAGFFLAYVGTRVKLSLIFVLSQWTNLGVAQTPRGAAVAIAGSAPPVPIEPAVGAAPVGPVAEARAEQEDQSLKQADQLLLSKSLSDLKSPAEIIAWANAKARSGDFASALTAYKDVQGKIPFTAKMQTDYATILAAAGDTAGADNVVNAMATSGLAPEAEREARQRVAAATQAGKAAELRTRLQQGLYKPPQERGYEDAVAAGEELLKLDSPGNDPWPYVWLASAYGQRHAALNARADRSAEEQAQFEAAPGRVVELVERALAADPKVKPTLQGLYDPSKRVGNDNDLDSLRGNSRLDELLVEKPEAREEAEGAKAAGAAPPEASAPPEQEEPEAT